MGVLWMQSKNTLLAEGVFCLVPKGGLEPPRPKALVPKTSVSTNSTTPAHLVLKHSTKFFDKKPVVRPRTSFVEFSSNLGLLRIQRLVATNRLLAHLF